MGIYFALFDRTLVSVLTASLLSYLDKVSVTSVLNFFLVDKLFLSLREGICRNYYYWIILQIREGTWADEGAFSGFQITLGFVKVFHSEWIFAIVDLFSKALIEMRKVILF